MDGQATAGVLRYFVDLPDPRACNVIHKLNDILTIAICAVICGANGWVEVEQFGVARAVWFGTFLDLPSGIPSHDTFGRLFAQLNPDDFEKCFVAWTSALVGTGQRLIAIDGKTIRRSFEHAWDKSGMTHLVSAFVEANHTVFGQLAVKEKSNEIEVIPRLLSLLDLEGATITIDAMGCQKEVAQQIHQSGGDYVLAVKENQPTLHQKVKMLLDEAILDGFENMNHDRFQSTDGGHGRIETRKIWVSDQVHWLGELLEQWPGLTAVAAVESKRQVIGGKTSVQRRYFITNRPNASAQWIAQTVRGHWAVENQLHWQLDVSFDEDQRRIRKHYGAENYSRLCRIALNLLKRDKSAKIGIHGKRLKAGWDLAYLLKVFTG